MNGLQKLQETADQVAEMRVELEALQPKLVIAQRETDEKLVQVKGKQGEADEYKKVVQADEAVAEAAADDVRRGSGLRRGRLGQSDGRGLLHHSTSAATLFVV